jgi:hypothetical protein
MVYWCSGSGRIEIKMTKAQAASASHSGSCDDDVATLLKVPTIARQLKRIDPQLLATELREYGAWDGPELTDHEQNIARIVWIAAGDIADGHF